MVKVIRIHVQSRVLTVKLRVSYLLTPPPISIKYVALICTLTFYRA